MYRIDLDSQDTATLVFVGQLDIEALRELQVRCLANPVQRLRLGANTQVCPECIGELAKLGVEVEAESAYLARWLTEVRRATGR